MKYTYLISVLSSIALFSMAPAVADPCYEMCSGYAYACIEGVTKLDEFDPANPANDSAKSGTKVPGSCKACYIYQFYMSPNACTLQGEKMPSFELYPGC